MEKAQSDKIAKGQPEPETGLRQSTFGHKYNGNHEEELLEDELNRSSQNDERTERQGQRSNEIGPDDQNETSRRQHGRSSRPPEADE